MPSCIKLLSGQDAGVLVKSLGTGRQVLVKQQPLHTLPILRHYEFGTCSFRVQGQAGMEGLSLSTSSRICVFFLLTFILFVRSPEGTGNCCCDKPQCREDQR